LAYSNAGIAIYIWEANTGKVLDLLKGHTALAPNIPLAFTCDGLSIVASSLSDGLGIDYPSVTTISSTNATESAPLIMDRKSSAYRHFISFSYSPTSGLLAVLSSTGMSSTVDLFNYVFKGKFSWFAQLTIPNEHGSAMTISENGKLLAVGYVDGDVNVFDLVNIKDTPTRVHFFSDNLGLPEGVSNSVRAVSFSPTGDTLAAGAGDIEVTRRRPASLRPGVRDTEISTRPFVSNATPWPLRLYSLKLHRLLQNPVGITQPVSDISWLSPTTIILVSNHGQVLQWDTEDEHAIDDVLPGRDITELALSPDRDRIATIERGRMTVWKVSLENNRDPK
jgi:WD40 repeat protein